MSDKKFVVGYDGSQVSRRAAELAVEYARSNGATVLIVHVLEWSPYTFLTPDEIEERHKRREEELSRAQTTLVDPLKKDLADSGVNLDSIIKYGQVAQTLSDTVVETQADQIFIGRAGDDGVVARVFGSVAATLAQITPVPCTLVP